MPLSYWDARNKDGTWHLPKPDIFCSTSVVHSRVCNTVTMVHVYRAG